MFFCPSDVLAGCHLEKINSRREVGDGFKPAIIWMGTVMLFFELPHLPSAQGQF